MVAEAAATTSTTADITVNPPVGASCTSYTVSVCPAATPTQNCVQKTWPTNMVPFDSLTPGGEYVVSSTCVSNGVTTPASNVLPLEMPGAGKPTVTFADDSSSTTALAKLAPPSGVTCDK